ncbi:MAG: hydrolase, alpha/beta fold family [Labilithrix sp.]|nr:hydrolase, alpha/beta fold family [Labilithrix sp.]
MKARLAGASIVAALLGSTGCMSFHKGALPDEPRTATFAEVDGAHVRFIDTGEPERELSPAAAQAGTEPVAAPARPTVVLVHGFASSLDAWATVTPVLAKTYRVIAMDLKGFGWSDRPEGDYSPDAQAKLVLHLLEQRGVTRAMFVAHSWGSSVVLAAALRAPERVSKIALYDAWVYEEQLPTFFHWSRAAGVGEALFGLYYTQRSDERIALAFYDQKFVTEALVENVQGQIQRPGTVAAALAAVRGQDYEGAQERYHRIDKPVMLLWGREDLVTPVKYGERLVRDLPNAKLTVYPRCGHFPMIEAANASNRDLLAYLAEP